MDIFWDEHIDIYERHVSETQEQELQFEKLFPARHIEGNRFKH